MRPGGKPPSPALCVRIEVPTIPAMDAALGQSSGFPRATSSTVQSIRENVLQGITDVAVNNLLTCHTTTNVFLIAQVPSLTSLMLMATAISYAL